MGDELGGHLGVARDRTRLEVGDRDRGGHPESRGGLCCGAVHGTHGRGSRGSKDGVADQRVRQRHVRAAGRGANRDQSVAPGGVQVVRAEPEDGEHPVQEPALRPLGHAQREQRRPRRRRQRFPGSAPGHQEVVVEVDQVGKRQRRRSAARS